MALPASVAPLQGPAFRGLWLAWLAANMTMWMNDVAAAWLMTTLTTSPVMVALVQTASTLPVFLLGLPSGALADIVDRRRYFAFTQLWLALVALVLAALAAAGALTAELLLLLTFANGVGLAMRWPVFSAIVPEVVPREQLPQALALSGISMNLSRVVGPVVAGSMLGFASGAAVFAVNALLAAVALWLILRWRSRPRVSALPGERFLGALRVGVQHVRQSPRMRVILLRISLFFFQASALVALLPLVARGMGGGPAMYTLMLASMGAGAITAALLSPRWRRRFSRDAFVSWGTLVHAVASATVALGSHPVLVLPALFVAGMAWVSTANTLSVAAQLALPNWVRARGMATFQVALMGGSALGALLFGKFASLAGVPAAILAAAILGILSLVWLRRVSVEGEEVDFSPAPVMPAPGVAIDIGPDEGPVMVTVEYLIDPRRAAEFAGIMQLTRAARLRQGALSWGLFRDTSVPGRYVEYFVDEDWIEHQRRLERFTAADAELRERRLGFHIGPAPPSLRRYVADPLVTEPHAPM